MSADTVIETRDLSRRFRQQLAVDGVSLRVDRGDVYGFLGLNGAGKTTTLRMILGLLKPTRGEVRLFGRSPEEDRRSALGRIGALVESPAFYPQLSGRRNLMLLGSLSQPVDARRADEVLDQVGLLAAGGKRAADYSLGMKQRLAIALALVSRPELVILDEPTNGLDPNGILEMRRLIRRLNEEDGVTFVISSHLLYEIEMTCSRVAILESGRLVVEDDLGRLMAGAAAARILECGPGNAAGDILRSTDGIAAIVADGGGGRWRFELDGDRVPDLVRRLVAAGVEVRSLAEHRPTLEELFLARSERRKEGRLS